MDETSLNPDGMKSRKFLTTAITLGVTWGTATVGWLVLDKMSAAEWVDYTKWSVPVMLGAYQAVNILEKMVLKR